LPQPIATNESTVHRIQVIGSHLPFDHSSEARAKTDHRTECYFFFVRLFVLALLGLGCASERVVATRGADGATDAGEADAAASLAPCGEAPIVLAVADGPRLSDLEAFGAAEALLFFSDDESSLGLRLGADGRVRESRELGSRLAQLEPVVVVDDAGTLHVAAHNHALEGRWRIYYERLVSLAEGWSWDEAVAVSPDGPEALDAQITRDGASIAIAYRQQNALWLDTFVDGGSVGRGGLSAEGALPFAEGLARAADGYRLLQRRGSRFSLHAFDADATPRGERGAWDANDGVLLDADTVVLATAAGVEVRRLDDAPRVVPLPHLAQRVAAAAGADGTVWVAALQVDGSATLLGLAPSGETVRATLSDAARDVRVVAFDGRPLVVWVEAGAPDTVYARSYCPSSDGA